MNERITQLEGRIANLQSTSAANRAFAAKLRLQIADLGSQANEFERNAAIAENQAEDAGRELGLAQAELARAQTGVSV